VHVSRVAGQQNPAVAVAFYQARVVGGAGEPMRLADNEIQAGDPLDGGT
jgi:hypothetical protein